MDHRKILTVFLVYPSESEGTSQERVFSIKQPRERIYPLTGKLDMDWWVEKEWSAEAGNMLVTGMCVPHSTRITCLAIVVCGSPQFERSVRKAIRSSRRNISFSNSDFQPDETPLSSLRYRT